MKDSKKRFTERVEDYIKYRPGYPEECIDYLVSEVGLRQDSVVADVGSGTGILSSLLLPVVQTVYAVEPNLEMRIAAENQLSGNSHFLSVTGSSTDTGLPDNSVDFITAAQAFHWFPIQETLKEFKRIGKESCNMVLIWNSRKKDTDFLEKYDKILMKYANDYQTVNHQNLTDEKLSACYNGKMTKKTFSNYQKLNWDGVKGRLLSSSYCPKEGEKNYEPLMSAMKELFDGHIENGIVTLTYDTELYWGSII